MYTLCIYSSVYQLRSCIYRSIYRLRSCIYSSLYRLRSVYIVQYISSGTIPGIDPLYKTFLSMYQILFSLWNSFQSTKSYFSLWIIWYIQKNYLTLRVRLRNDPVKPGRSKTPTGFFFQCITAWYLIGYLCIYSTIYNVLSIKQL